MSYTNKNTQFHNSITQPNIERGKNSSYKNKVTEFHNSISHEGGGGGGGRFTQQQLKPLSVPPSVWQSISWCLVGDGALVNDDVLCMIP